MYSSLLLLLLLSQQYMSYAVPNVVVAVVYRVTVPTPDLVCRVLFLTAAFFFLFLRYLRRCVVGKAWMMFPFAVALLLVKSRHYFLAAHEQKTKNGPT